MSGRRAAASTAAAWAVLLASALARAVAGSPPDSNPAEAMELPTVDVIGTSPLPGLGTPIEDVPANVQVYTGAAAAQPHQGNVSDFLAQRAGSINSNAAQGNPFQPDLAFRGFTASPLLGTPQGLSVFQDGVRVNEPFGDVVNWDLIPQSAISSIQLIPGSNPAFGLNTLGGALAVYTKSGAQYPGAACEASAGSFGRRTAECDWGGARGAFDVFLTGNYFDDRGWADHNPSVVRQFFGKVGWQDELTDLDAALTAVNNTLQGTQTLPLSLLADPRQAYTWPDANSNQLGLLTLKGSHFLDPAVLLGGNAYYRQYRNASFNSDVNSDFGSLEPATGLADLVQASNDVAQVDQDSYGAGLQLTLSHGGRHPSQFTLGASADIGHAHYRQQSQAAFFSAGRETLGSGPFVPVVDAETRNSDFALFAADVLHVSPRVSLTVSGRYDRAEAGVIDRSGGAPQLDGTHVFTRFDPAAGVNFNPHQGLTLYAGYSEGMRAPTPIELTCADRDAPCKLPNDFVSDPPLAPVVARTVELGARGRWRAWQWSAALYQSRLSNDIEFISSNAGASDAGYFANVGATRRTGLELAAATQAGRCSLSARYSFIDASFRSGFAEFSPDNSSANAGGAISVSPGDLLPGIPRHTLKLRLDYALSAHWGGGANLLATSGVYARGDENNQDANGALPGYLLVNLDAYYQPAPALQFFARVNNALDRRYADFGILGQNFFTGAGGSFGPPGTPARAEQFRAPGAPLGVWIGVRYTFGGASAANPVRDTD